MWHVSCLLSQDSGSGVGGTFARTGHAMRVMERIAVALSCNEPTLLVGETGRTSREAAILPYAMSAGEPVGSYWLAHGL